MGRPKTQKEILEHMAADQIDFEELLEPYREGGTQQFPIRRTMGTIVDYLLNKKKYPKEIVGSAVLGVFLELKAGRRFHGDGTYGSPGRALVSYLRRQCDTLLHIQHEKEANAFADSLLFALREAQRLTFRARWGDRIRRWCMGLSGQEPW